MKAFNVSQILFAFAALTGLSSCFVQTMNSVNGDAKAFQPLPANSSAAFTQVRAIIAKNCVSCHGEFASYSEADFVSNKLVVPKNANASELFQNLKGSGAGNGEMPKDGAPLSPADIQSFRNWIETMGNVTSTGPTTLFGQSQIIVRNSCVGCHQEISGYQEADYAINGWVVPGNADASKLYYKSIGADVTGEPVSDMPLDSNPLSSDDLQTLRQWINQMIPANFPAPVIPANTPFGKVQKIITDNCIKCHDEDFTGNTESDFITKNFVTPGNPQASSFYARLIGSTPTSPNSDMPQTGAQLTTEQLQDVAAWINQLPVPPTATDLAVLQIRADFEKTIQPLVLRGCMDCHNSKATPDGWLGKLPIFRQIEEKHIREASAIIDFSQPYPNWSTEKENPSFYLNEMQTVLDNGSMPPWDYKIFHEHDGGILKPAETQTVLSWVTQSLTMLQTANPKPTASSFFSEKCLGCHNSNKASGGFAFEKNGDEVTVPTGNTKSGTPFITQMDPGNSAVYLVLLADDSQRKGLTQMPYKASTAQLATDAERQLISDWINQKTK